MKARLISVLLVIALLVTVGVITAQAAAADPNTVCAAADDLDPTTATTCPYCSDTVTWQALPAATEETTLAADGHYYVAAETLSNSAQYVLEGTACVHLNGNTISSTSTVFQVANGKRLNIMGGGTVIGAHTGTESTASAGATITVAGGDLYLMGGTYQHAATSEYPTIVQSSGKIRIYEGTSITAATGAKGTNLMITDGVTYMYGGVIANGVASKTGTSARWGGNLLLKPGSTKSAATFYIYDGEIYGGTAQNGGNIGIPAHFSSGTTAMNLRVLGGKIYNGEAESKGGNIYILAKKAVNFRIWKDASYDTPEVYGGKAAYGGNLYLEQQGTATFNNWFRGGKIYNGTATQKGGNIYLDAVYTTTDMGPVGSSSYTAVEIYGGEAKQGGNICLTGRTKLNISGNATISGGTAEQGGSICNDGATVTVNSGASISGGIAKGNIAASNTRANAYAGGNILSSGTLTTKAGATISNGTADIGGNIAVIGGTATINGTVSGGKAERVRAYAAGGNIFVDSATVTIGATVTGATEFVNTNTHKWGGNIGITNTSTADPVVATNVTLDGATVTGGFSRLQGGSIWVEGANSTLTIKGTTEITGGQASKHDSYSFGGNIFVEGATLDIQSGTISGGQTCYYKSTTNEETQEVTETYEGFGGNIYLNGATCTMSGGTITGGTTNKRGGNVYLTDNSEMTMTGGTITEGVARSGGGNIYIAAGKNTLIMNSDAAVISAGSVTNGSGGNISNLGTLTVTAGTIGNGMDSENNVIKATASGSGGSIYNAGTGAITFENGANVSGGHCPSSGGTIYVNGGTVTFNGGTFTGGEGINGGFLFTNEGVVTVNGGTFNEGNGSYGTSSGVGNTIYMRAGELKLFGGTFNVTSETTLKNAVYLGGFQSGGVTSTNTAYLPKLTIGGAGATVAGDAKNAIAVNALGALNVQDDYTGNMYIWLDTGLVSSPYYGKTVINTEYVEAGYNVKGTFTRVANEESTGYTGTLLLCRVDEPAILHDGNGGLVVAGAQYTTADGAKWATVQGALDAADATGIKLYENNAEVTISGETKLVDLNGKTITVNKADDATAATFNGFNSRTSAAGIANLGDGVTNSAKPVSDWTENEKKTGGWYYISNETTDSETGVTTVKYHKLEMIMTSISLRYTTGGFYYQAVTNTDDDLRAQITASGIHVGAATADTLVNMQTAMYGVTNETLFSEDYAFKSYEVEDSANLISAWVKNIVKTDLSGQENLDRASYYVVGTPFVLLNDETLLNCQTGMAKSLVWYLEKANTAYEADATTLGKLKVFCDTYHLLDEAVLNNEANAEFVGKIANIIAAAPYVEEN